MTAAGRPPHEPTFAGTPSFPVAAKAALADGQLRANLGRATATIRTKRAAAVAERDDWQDLRLAGAAIKDDRRMIAAASASTSCGGTSNPVRSCSTISGMPPTSVATTGRLSAIASSTASPSASR